MTTRHWSAGLALLGSASRHRLARVARDHLRGAGLEALDSIDANERAGVYAASFFVHDEEDDPRLPTVTIGFNTEHDVAEASDPQKPFLAL